MTRRRRPMMRSTRKKRRTKFDCQDAGAADFARWILRQGNKNEMRIAKIYELARESEFPIESFYNCLSHPPHSHIFSQILTLITRITHTLTHTHTGRRPRRQRVQRQHVAARKCGGRHRMQLGLVKYLRGALGRGAGNGRCGQPTQSRGRENDRRLMENFSALFTSCTCNENYR
jgi:hypothetical protein